MRPGRRGLLLLTLMLAAPAVAAPRPVALVWTRDAAASNCPDDEQMRQAVAARLGYAPFDDAADTVVKARVEQKQRALVGTIEVERRGGPILGRRELSSAAGDCAELASAMQLAIAIAIDPQYLRRTRRATPAPTRPPDAEPIPSALPPAAPEPEPTPATIVNFTSAVGGLGSAGLSPSIAPGVTLRLALEWRRFSIGLDVRGDLSSHATFGRSGALATSAILGSISPCLRVWRIDACALVSAGALQVTSSLAGQEERHQTSPLVLAGARAQLVLPLSEFLSLRPFVEAQGSVVRTTLVSGAQTVWATSPVVGALGVALGVRFF